MKTNETIVKDFFNTYEKFANTFDAKLFASLYADNFVSAEPNGTSAGTKQAFIDAIPEKKAMFESIGFQKAEILDLSQNWLDEHYVLAKTKWRMTFKNKDSKVKKAVFDESYLLYVDNEIAKVAVFISHEDEAQLMKTMGLID